MEDIQEMNILKSLLVVVINGVGVAIFIADSASRAIPNSLLGPRITGRRLHQERCLGTARINP